MLSTLMFSHQQSPKNWMKVDVQRDFYWKCFSFMHIHMTLRERESEENWESENWGKRLRVVGKIQLNILWIIEYHHEE